MLKCEKYVNEIAKGLAWDEECNFIKKYILKKDDCSNMACSECERKIAQWMLEEYRPEIDWLKVPVDTPVLVKDNGCYDWQKRHFALYLPKGNFKFCVIAAGKNHENAGNVAFWEQCKLADDVDPTPYLKE